MLADHAAIVRQTWTVAAAQPAALAAHFHARLLWLEPTLGLLFVDADLDARGRSLVRMLDLATANLERLSPAGHRPAARPAGSAVCHALLDALAEVVGPHRWTATAHAAWLDVIAAMVDALRVPDVQAPDARARLAA